MRIPLMHRWIIALCVGVLSSLAAAETVKLELKKLSDRTQARESVEFLFRMTQSQGFGANREDAEGNKRREADFASLIKKQPEKYACAYPFRGIARLGTQQFGFVLDSTNVKRGYDRLYFDVNGNGDLTDEKVIESRQGRETYFSTSYARGEFPRVDVTIDVDGTKLDYAFFMSYYAYGLEDGQAPQYVGASLNAGVYRDGKIKLDGQEHRIVVLDYDCTGRFDDQYRLEKDAVMYNGQLVTRPGDMLLLDPNTKPSEEYFGYGLTERKERMAASKLLCIGEKYYEMKITPVGDELTLTPYTGAVAEATNAGCDYYEAVVYGENGVLKITGERNQPIKLPVGEWRVMDYRIEARPPKPAPKPDAEKTDAKPAADKPADKPAEEAKPKPKRTALSKAVGSWLGAADTDDEDEEEEITLSPASRRRRTYVSADATKDTPTFKVEAGKTVFMKFGPPYQPKVQVSGGREERDVRLSLAIVGSGGELVNDLLVNGNRPKAPSFQIISPSGEIIHRGKFEFG